MVAFTEEILNRKRLFLCSVSSLFQIFGPVQSILKFKTVDEVIKRANDTTYGLAAGVITNDINKALKVISSVKAGSMWYEHVENCWCNFNKTDVRAKGFYTIQTSRWNIYLFLWEYLEAILTKQK